MIIETAYTILDLKNASQNRQNRQNWANTMIFWALSPNQYEMAHNDYLSLLLAVKFGRMSKKQREKVEDEAKYHKSRMSGLSEDGSSPRSTSICANDTSTNNNNMDLQK